jgi:hypothetical protein
MRMHLDRERTWRRRLMTQPNGSIKVWQRLLLQVLNRRKNAREKLAPMDDAPGSRGWQAAAQQDVLVVRHQAAGRLDGRQHHR